MKPDRRSIGLYLEVERLPVPSEYRTRRWAVFSKAGSFLGMVGWFSRWRQYTFNPADKTTFNEDCLTGIAAFLKDENDRQRRKDP